MDDRLSISALCFPGMPPLAVLENVAELGATHTTLHVAAVAEAGPATVRSHGEAIGVGVEALIAGVGPTLDDNATWAGTRDRLRGAVDVAAATGADLVYMLTGSRKGSQWDEAVERLGDFISPCIDHAAACGVHLAVEPAMVLYADLTFVHTARDAFALAARIPGLTVDLDLFHVWTERDLRDGITSHVDLIGLVQVGDFAGGDRSLPARAVPGDGLIPIAEILGWLSVAGYDGIVDLELNGPRIDEEGHLRAARRGASALDSILRSLRP
jgi:sugar phosphate isomerase/epimerase